MTSLLEVDGITVTYGGITAVRNVSLHVEEGEFVALLGSNGAGKTTCIEAVMGGVDCAAGEIIYNEEEITGLSPRGRVEKGIAISPEDRELFLEMTVRENLDLGGYTIDDADRLATLRQEVYELFPVLEERSQQLAQTLSGGQQQMVAIARSLMSDPDLLLLDEPSLGLAPTLVTQTGEFIERLRQQRNTTILMVEQNIEIPFEYADRVYLIQNGEIADERTVEELTEMDAVRESYMGI